MRNTVIFVVFVLAVMGLLFAISGDRSPRIPEDERHAGLTEQASCRECHAPGREAALSPDHPPKEQCLLCHKRKRTRR
jgi:hypothetical protein